MDLIWIELSRNALVHNLQVLQELGQGAVCSPCIKANAYGHGLREVTSILRDERVESVTVSTLEESRVVREVGFEGRIILINYVFPEHIEEVVKLDVEVMVYDRRVLEEYEEKLSKAGKKLKVHVVVETGMGRYGILPEQVGEYVDYVQSSKNFELFGVMSHFAMADGSDDEYVNYQKEIFGEVEEVVSRRGIEVEFHIANSAGTIRQETKKLFRPGLALYGYVPSEEMQKMLEKKSRALQPVMSLKSIVTSVKELPKNHCVGYDCTFQLKRDSRVAVVPIGYADGYERRLSNCGEVNINGLPAPVIGRVCMNLIMVDVTDIAGVKIRDEVVLIGKELNADMIAERVGAISYEILPSLRESIPKHIV
jgi:alanine racemase